MIYKFYFPPRKDPVIVEADNNIVECLKTGERELQNLIARDKYHNVVSYDALRFEGPDFGYYDTYNFGEKSDLELALEKLTPIELSRLYKYSTGMTAREIALEEDRSTSAVTKSIRSARSKCKKSLRKQS